MVVRALVGSSCGRWEVRETSSAPEVYTCGKCNKLDNLRIVWETEGFINRSYNEVVTAKQLAERWASTRNGSRWRVHCDHFPVNKITLLDTIWRGVTIQRRAAASAVTAVALRHNRYG